MTFVLTLISRPADRALTAAAIDTARRALTGAGATSGRTEVLAPELACDIAFDSDDETVAEAEVRRSLSGLPIDVAVQESRGRRKRLLAADMESTVIENEMLDDLAGLIDPSGALRERVATVTARAMRGEVDFRDALRERAALIEGCPVATLEEAAQAIALTPGARTLVRTMKRHGAVTLLLSGGFPPFTELVREAVGFDRVLGNTLEARDGRLTGRVLEPILDRQGKRAALEGTAKECGVPLSASLAVGDGANDLPMIQAAGLGVAFRAKPALAEAARVRIDHGDLTALLYLQGYRADDLES
jgi:phosphoserine phosphatase